MRGEIKGKTRKKDSLSYLRKHLLLFRRYLALNFKELIEFKSSLYFMMFLDALWLVVWIFFWWVIIGEINMLEGWSLQMLIILSGFSLLFSGVFSIFRGIFLIYNEVLSGRLDIHLTKPIHTWLAVVGERMGIIDFSDVIFGIGIIIATIITYKLNIALVNLTLAFMVSIIGVFIGLLIFATAGVLSFWVGRTEAFIELVDMFYVFKAYPITIFPKLVLGFLTFGVPIAFFGTFPTLMMVEYTAIQCLGIMGIELIILIVWFFIFNFLWKQGIKRYESGGG